MDRPAVKDSPEGTILTIHVQPNARRTEFVGFHSGALKFRVAAPPVEGAANDELCSYLAKRFGLPQKAVIIKTGQGSRHKRVLLAGVSAQRVRAVLAES